MQEMLGEGRTTSTHNPRHGSWCQYVTKGWRSPETLLNMCEMGFRKASQRRQHFRRALTLMSQREWPTGALRYGSLGTLRELQVPDSANGSAAGEEAGGGKTHVPGQRMRTSFSLAASKSGEGCGYIYLLDSLPWWHPQCLI